MAAEDAPEAPSTAPESAPGVPAARQSAVCSRPASDVWLVQALARPGTSCLRPGAALLTGSGGLAGLALEQPLVGAATGRLSARWPGPADARRPAEGDSAAPASDKHPLENKWTLWHDPGQQGGKTHQHDYGQQMDRVYTFDTVEDFWWCASGVQGALQRVSPIAGPAQQQQG